MQSTEQPLRLDTPAMPAARSDGLTLRQASIVAGISLLLMAVLAPIAQFKVLQTVVVPGDASATANQLAASAGLVRLAICLLLVVALLDIVVAWALYYLLRPASASLSLLAAWLRVAYAVIFAAALNHLINALQLNAQASFLVGAFQSQWSIGLAIFGVHLLALGFLMLRSDHVPRLLGALIMVAGLGYLADSSARILAPHWNLAVAKYTFLGEVLLIFWLLWRGTKGFTKRSAAHQ